MINYIAGTVKKITDTNATILVNGIGLSITMPKTEQLTINKTTELHTYLHWNQESGPSIYGFSNELERSVFLMIIDCPKIGPSLAIKILSQLSASHFLEIITSQDEKALSSINGIGTKKAEQLVVQLKHKVEKLINSGIISEAQEQQNFIQWQNINDVLTSLNYSKKEISMAMNHLTKTYKEENQPLDKLIRASLAYLSKQKNS